MKTIAVIQARMQSSRLPGKVMKRINGRPMLDHVVTRVDRSRLIDETIVAASDQPADRPIWDWCRDNGFACVIGDQNDVLSRYQMASAQHSPSKIVRITSDCPLIDSDVIDQTVQILHDQPHLDYACNFFPIRTYPRGLDVEVMTAECLNRVSTNATKLAEREHVTLRIYRNPQDFRIGHHHHSTDYSGLRWTVDTRADLNLAREIYDYFGPKTFGFHEILEAYQSNFYWRSLNDQIQQKAA